MLRITAAIATACLTCIFAASSADARAHYALTKLVLHLPYFYTPQPVAITDEGISVGSIVALGYAEGYTGSGSNITTYRFCSDEGFDQKTSSGTTTISGISPYSLGEFIAGECSSSYGYVYDVSTNTFVDLYEPVASNGFNDVAGVSAGGIVVGSFPDQNDIDLYHGFYFESGNYLTFDPPGSLGTSPLGINLGNTVFGYYVNSDNNGVRTESGFLLDEFGDYTILNVPGAGVTEVTGLNGHNQAVGYSGLSVTGPFVGFSWQNNTFTTFPLSSSASQATAINENGIVVGTWVDTLNITHGFVWNPAAVSVITVYSPSGGSLYITGINNANQITGYYNAVVKSHETQIGFTGTCKGKGCF